MNIQRNVVVLVFVLVSATAGFTQEGDYVSFERKAGYFSMVSEKTAAPVVFDDGDYPGVTRVARNFQIDVERVTRVKPELTTTLPKSKRVIIVGTVGKHELIGELVAAKKIDVSSLKGKWEMFITQIVNKPFPGVEQALVIVGSDKRGTIYGLYDLCEHIGVSPWNWWADVPVKKHQEIYVKPGRYTLGEPAVKYRGIFINDEQPALGGWVAQNYGGFKSGFYEKVFDLILRMKGNFLWPAMWGQSFYTDDPLNPKLADECTCRMEEERRQCLELSDQCSAIERILD